jgi:hypothetical protein
MISVLLLPAAILLSLRLLHYIFVPPRQQEFLDEHVMRLQHRLRSGGLILLAVGVLASIWIYRDADPAALETRGVISYEIGDGYLIPMHAADSKRYSRELEKIGGKLGMFFTDVGVNLDSAFHGRNLAYLLFALSLASCLGCLAGARAVTVTYSDGESDGGRGNQPVTPDRDPTPPSRTVRWTLKSIRRSRPVRTPERRLS